MKVVIPGGSGQVGTILARAFHGDGHQVVVLSRRPGARPWRVVAWDGATLGGWQTEIDGCDAVINLGGRSVNCRYTAANREEILQSRVVSTRVVGQAIARASRKPRVWLQASTATIYAHRYDSPNDEHSGILGGNEPTAPSAWRFSIEVARAWERAFEDAVTESTRKIALRSAMTLSPDPGGIFDALGPRTPRPRRQRRRRPAIHLVDSLRRLRCRCSLADRSRRHRRGCERRVSKPLTECGVHAAAPRGLWRPLRPACNQVDARDWCGLHAHGNRAHSQKPSGCSGQIARARLHLHIPGVEQRCA